MAVNMPLTSALRFCIYLPIRQITYKTGVLLRPSASYKTGSQPINKHPMQIYANFVASNLHKTCYNKDEFLNTPVNNKQPQLL